MCGPSVPAEVEHARSSPAFLSAAALAASKHFTLMHEHELNACGGVVIVHTFDCIADSLKSVRHRIGPLGLQPGGDE